MFDEIPILMVLYRCFDKVDRLFRTLFPFFFFSPFFFPLRKRYSIAPALDHEFFTNSNIAATFFSPLYLSLSVSRLNGD